MIYRVHIVLNDDRGFVGTKDLCIDTDDIDAGLYLYEMKRRELFRDIASHSGHHYRAFDRFLDVHDRHSQETPQAGQAPPGPETG